MDGSGADEPEGGRHHDADNMQAHSMAHHVIQVAHGYLKGEVKERALHLTAHSGQEEELLSRQAAPIIWEEHPAATLAKGWHQPISPPTCPPYALGDVQDPQGRDEILAF